MIVKKYLYQFETLIKNSNTTATVSIIAESLNDATDIYKEYIEKEYDYSYKFETTSIKLISEVFAKE
jgi:hypothetical protein